MTRPALSGIPWGAIAAIAVGLYACRPREGERCVCGDDCVAVDRDGNSLKCVSDGRVLRSDECIAVVGNEAEPGTCVADGDAIGGDGMNGPLPDSMDSSSKRDFDPGLPPDPMDPPGPTDASSTGQTSTTDATGTATTGGSTN